MKSMFRDAGQRLSRICSARDAWSAVNAATWRRIAVSLACLALVLGAYFFGQQWLHLREGGSGDVTDMMARAGTAPVALASVIALFCALALTGFPQFLLIAASVTVFNPVTGGIYAWLATMVSAALTFGLGALSGGGWVERLRTRTSGDGARRGRFGASLDFLSRRAILASGLVRLVPSGPFIVVNATAGAARLPLWKFLLGTGIGIIPKIAFVAALMAMAPDGKTLVRGPDAIAAYFASRTAKDWALMAAIVLLWAVFLWGIRKVYKRVRLSG